MGLGGKEKMTSGFYFGALIILFTVFANAYVKKRGLPFIKKREVDAVA